MIRLDDKDSAALATIAQYQQLPEKKKLALVAVLSPEAKPIGRILIGRKVKNPSGEALIIAERFQKWTSRNKMTGSSRRRRNLGSELVATSAK